MNSSVLHRIADSVRLRLRERQSALPEAKLQSLCEKARSPHPFKAAFSAKTAFSAGSPKIIAEIKFSSPSQGQLAKIDSMTPDQVAREYLEGGATALSILTERDHFQGDPDYLRKTRLAFPEARLLMKDFVLERYQLLEARVWGADAALLIVALLGKEKTRSLLSDCRSLGLTALVEVHDEDEMKTALEIGADMIGVNNRDLKTLKISLDTSFKLAKLAESAPSDTCFISESGLDGASELKELSKVGYRGFLIGTSLMKTGTPGKALAKLLAEAK